MIKVRRVGRGWHVRRQYEVAYLDELGTPTRPLVQTSLPIFEVERELHTTDAWAVIHEANRLWETARGEWAEWPPPELQER